MANIDPIESDELSLLAKKRLEEERLLRQVDKSGESIEIATGNRLDEDTLAISDQTEKIEKDPLALSKQLSLSKNPEKAKSASYLNSIKTAEELSTMSASISDYLQEGKKLLVPFDAANSAFKTAIDCYQQQVWKDEKMHSQDLLMFEKVRLAALAFKEKKLTDTEFLEILNDYNSYAKARNEEILAPLKVLNLAVADYNDAIYRLNKQIEEFNARWTRLGFSKIAFIEPVKGGTFFPLFQTMNLTNIEKQIEGASSLLNMPKTVNPGWMGFRGGLIESYLRTYQNLLAPMAPVTRQNELSLAELARLRFFFNNDPKSLKVLHLQNYPSAFFEKAAGSFSLTNITSSSLILGLESKFLERIFARNLFQALNIECGLELNSMAVEKLKIYVFDLLSHLSLLAAMPAYQLSLNRLALHELYSTSYTLCKTTSLAKTVVEVVQSDALLFFVPLLFETSRSKKKKEKEGSQDDQEEEGFIEGKQVAKNGIALTLLAIALYEISIALGLPALIPALFESTLELKQAYFESRPASGFKLDEALENLEVQADAKLYLFNRFQEIGLDEALEKASFAISSLVAQLPFKNSELLYKTLLESLKQLDIDLEPALKIAKGLMQFLETVEIGFMVIKNGPGAWRVDLAEEKIVSLLIKEGVQDKKAMDMARKALVELGSAAPKSDFESKLHHALMKAGLSHEKALKVASQVKPVFKAKVTFQSGLSLEQLEEKIAEEIDLFSGSKEIKKIVLDTLFGQVVDGKRVEGNSVIALLKKNIAELRSCCKNDRAKEKIMNIFHELTSPHLDLMLLHGRLMDPMDTFITSLKPLPTTNESPDQIIV